MSVEIIARLLLALEALACLGFAHFSWQQGHGGGTAQRTAAAIGAALFCAAALVMGFGVIS